jgi:hypothetical protein
MHTFVDLCSGIRIFSWVPTIYFSGGCQYEKKKKLKIKLLFKFRIQNLIQLPRSKIPSLQGN